MNCRIDTERHKSKVVVDYIENERLTLINKKDVKTYISDKGCSTIDLVFSNGNSARQTVLRNIIAREYLHVDTVVVIQNATKNYIRKKPLRMTRKIDPDKIAGTDTKDITEAIQKGNLDGAINAIEKYINDATAGNNKRNRRTKPWFKQDCYNARKDALIALKQALRNPRGIYLQEYSEARRNYRGTIRKAKENYQEIEERK
jgi:hypothetical protein